MSAFILFIIGATVFVILNFEKIIAEIQFRQWKKQSEGIHNYDADVIREDLNKIANSSFELKQDQLPHGRATWFVNSNSVFSGVVDTEELEFYGYSPVRSKEELEFKEYGVLLTQEGFFANYQFEDKDSNINKHKKYISNSEFFPFAGLWKVKYVPDKQVKWQHFF